MQFLIPNKTKEVSPQLNRTLGFNFENQLYVSYKHKNISP